MQINRVRQLRAMLLVLFFLSLFIGLPHARAAESIWLEAEHLDGIRGYCWPMGPPNMKQTAGHWALSGPGWAAEWSQGGESGFLSIATAADDDKAVASKTIDVPIAGRYFVWVRYGDWREKTERFQIRLEQTGVPPQTLSFGENAIVEEDNEQKLYWGWAFTWDQRPAELKKGAAKLSLVSTTKDPEPRQIDVIVLTTDEAYRPLIKDRPRSDSWDVLESYRTRWAGHSVTGDAGHGVTRPPIDLEPLARRKPDFNLPEAWKVKTFRDKGFVYLWNVSEAGETADWLSDDPQRVLVPYNVRDKDLIDAFKKKYAGQPNVPIFSDPRIVPAFHGAGPGIFATDPQTGEVGEAGRRFAKWLDANPNRAWGMMMNYHPGKPIGDKGQQMFAKYRDRYVGSISGESLGYFYPKPDEMRAATAAATTRRQLVDAFSPLTLRENAAKYKAIYGKDLDANAFQDVISCLSVGNIVYAPLLSNWGCRTIGYESSAATSSLLNMRWAFMRGIGRQGGNLTATYRSCNFGDSSTIFSNTGSFHTPQNIFDNYYSVFSGAGMTWYKMDIWYQYMAGSSMFYHEQGFDEFWRPGGTTAAGVRDIELSPKGKLVDRFLRTTAAEPDRGHPFTPVAFLVDYAHGWEPAPFWPNSFKNWHEHQDRFLFGDHERMLEEYFWTAYYPMGPESEKPMTATNEVYVPGVFGDMFDVIAAYPDVTRWRTIDTYPVVIAAGEIELTAAEGQRLAEYIERGGTFLLADAHLTGQGVAALRLPPTGPVTEAEGYRWLPDGPGDKNAIHSSQRFRFKPILPSGEPQRLLAQTSVDQPFCVAIDRGQGRLIYLSVAHGLGIDRRTIPVVPRLIAHLSRGLMPIEVDGDVQWLVNRTQTGWLVTLLNPAGQEKPQQGITATDFRQNRPVTIRSRVTIQTARDRLLTTDKLEAKNNVVRTEVPAGGVRIIELR